MTDIRPLNGSLKILAKGTDWTVKRDILIRAMADHVLAVHPRRGTTGVLEFRAKPIAWDNLLWSIMQIEGNETLPPSFRFVGSFICDVPALIQQDMAPAAEPQAIADQMMTLAAHAISDEKLWTNFDLEEAISNERPSQPYRYHMTRVLERITAGDHRTARDICTNVIRKGADLRNVLYSTDRQLPADKQGRRPSLSFFELAILWLDRERPSLISRARGLLVGRLG